LVPIERRAESPLFTPIDVTARRTKVASLTLGDVGCLLRAARLRALWWSADLGRSTSVGGAVTMAIPVGLALMAPLWEFFAGERARSDWS
jgi:hypothetical protein